MSRRPTPDDGETLLEVVISIAIMGIAFVALLGGVLMTASLSGMHRGQAEGNVQLLRAIEQVKAATYNATCVTTTPLYPVTPSVALWTYAQVSIEYWDATLNGGAGGFGATCLDNQQPTNRTQRIRIRLTSPDSRVAREQIFLKRG